MNNLLKSIDLGNPFASVEGAEAFATLYNLIETAKAERP